MKVLIACEESQAVCKEFRRMGHEAYSCDIMDCSGDNPEWHIKDDVIKIIDDEWDMMIAFPPCTHLAVSGAKHFEEKRKDGRQQEGIVFFMDIINAPIDKIAVENPIGIMSSLYRKPDQIIQPYYFGDEYQKTTCLWLKNIPKLYHNDKPNLFGDAVTHVDPGEFVEWESKDGKQKRCAKWYYDAFKVHGINGELRSKIRSKTFPGIAKAMAKQWGNIIP